MAGFSAHTSNRDKIDEIFADQLASGIDLFFGSNIEYYAPLKEEITKNYAFIDDMNDLNLSQPKIFASFEEIPLNNGGSKKPTADHETGGLEYNGETKEQLSDKMYTRTRHSDANVAYFVFGTVDCEFPEVIDNTQIGNLCKSIISAGTQ